MDRAAVLALLAALVAAGCAGAPTAVVDGAGHEGRAFVLDSDMALAADAAVGAVPLGWGWRQWLDGVTAPAWTSPPATAPYVVEMATATIVYEATQPVNTLGARPEWTVWFGVEKAIADHGFQPGSPALAPGARETATFELGLPAGGLVVAPGERLVLHVGSYYDDDAQRNAISVVTGPDASRLELVVLPLARLPDSRTSVETADTVELTGGRCLGLDPASDTDMAWLDVVADPAQGRLVGIDVAVDHTGGNGPPDVDFVLLDANGEVAGYAAGSAGIERLRLRAPNLEGAAPDAAWQLGVYACTPQRANADVRVLMHYA